MKTGDKYLSNLATRGAYMHGWTRSNALTKQESKVTDSGITTLMPGIPQHFGKFF